MNSSREKVLTIHQHIEADSLRITIAIASQYKWNLRQMDIKAAYLNAKLEEEI